MTALSLMFIGMSVAYVALISYRRWLLNPAPLFVIVHTLMFLGTVPLLDDASPADALHLAVLCVGMLFFVLGALIESGRHASAAAMRLGWWKQPLLVEANRRFLRILFVVLLLSAVITIAYYQVVGYNVLLLSVRSVISGSGPVDDVATLRLQAYSGDRYLAPGYVNQFKNIFLPLITAYFGLRFAALRERRDAVATIVAAPIALFGLLGTGQRTAFLTVALIFLACANASLSRTRVRRLNLFAAILIPAVFVISTAVLGRTVSSVSSFSDVAALIGEIGNRIFRDQQMGSVVGFRYIATQPIQFGQEWLQDLLGILPGQAGSPLSHEVFAMMYGTTRGTAPVSIWASMWHNFGWPGLIMIAFALGVALESIYTRLFRGPKTLFRLLTYSAFSVLLAMWVAGTPVTLINTGVVAVFLLHWLSRRSRQGVVVTSQIQSTVTTLHPLHASGYLTPR